MLAGSIVPPLPEDDHGTENCAALLQASIPLVWPSEMPDLQLRPTLHITLWPCAGKGARHYMEPVYSVSPSDQQIDRMEEPVGRTVPLPYLDQSG